MGVDTSEHRSIDTSNMLNYAFANYKLNKILNKEDVVGKINVKKGKRNTVDISVKEDVTDLINKSESKDYSYNINTDDVIAPVEKGKVIGNLEVVDDSGKVVKIVDLIVNDSIEKHNFFSLFYETFKKIINGYF